MCTDVYQKIFIPYTYEVPCTPGVYRTGAVQVYIYPYESIVADISNKPNIVNTLLYRYTRSYIESYVELGSAFHV